LNASFFWKNSLGEINILYKKIPIEIKFKEKIEKKDLRNILRFGRKFKIKKAILITKNLEKKEKINGMLVHYIPIIKFLLKSSEIFKEE
jgi:predicted AAA+ superfamily ATPase